MRALSCQAARNAPHGNRSSLAADHLWAEKATTPAPNGHYCAHSRAHNFHCEHPPAQKQPQSQLDDQSRAWSMISSALPLSHSPTCCLFGPKNRPEKSFSYTFIPQSSGIKVAAGPLGRSQCLGLVAGEHQLVSRPAHECKQTIGHQV